MPTVNTLVVDRADMLGLSQLYQLRGRVGRRGSACVRLPAVSARPFAERAGLRAVEDDRRVHRSRFRVQDRDARPRDPRGGQPARRGAVGAHRGGGLRPLRRDGHRGGRGAHRRAARAPGRGADRPARHRAPPGRLHRARRRAHGGVPAPGRGHDAKPTSTTYGPSGKTATDRRRRRPRPCSTWPGCGPRASGSASARSRCRRGVPASTVGICSSRRKPGCSAWWRGFGSCPTRSSYPSRPPARSRSPRRCSGCSTRSAPPAARRCADRGNGDRPGNLRRMTARRIRLRRLAVPLVVGVIGPRPRRVLEQEHRRGDRHVPRRQRRPHRPHHARRVHRGAHPPDVERAVRPRAEVDRQLPERRRNRLDRPAALEPLARPSSSTRSRSTRSSTNATSSPLTTDDIGDGYQPDEESIRSPRRSSTRSRRRTRRPSSTGGRAPGALLSYFETCPSGRFVSHILLKTKAQADAELALDQLRAGHVHRRRQGAVDRHAPRRKVGGALGCLSPGEFIPVFEDAAHGRAARHRDRTRAQPVRLPPDPGAQMDRGRRRDVRRSGAGPGRERGRGGAHRGDARHGRPALRNLGQERAGRQRQHRVRRDPADPAEPAGMP